MDWILDVGLMRILMFIRINTHPSDVNLMEVMLYVGCIVDELMRSVALLK
jgi:hypothetical protein